MIEPPAERYKLDLEIPCPHCHAPAGKDCVFDKPPPTSSGLPCVHLTRRVKALLLERRPDLLEPPS